LPLVDRTPADTYDLEAMLGFLLYKAHQRSFAEFRRLLEPLGLTPPQFGVLALLHHRDAQSQAMLCERGAADPNTMVGIIDRLEAAGLVRRCRNPCDRRVYLVRITAAGRRMFARCVPLQQRATARCWVALSAREQRRLRTLLRKALRAPKPSAEREPHSHD
jgi:DNA-binding MarR family transcriptional regulator